MTNEQRMYKEMARTSAEESGKAEYYEAWAARSGYDKARAFLLRKAIYHALNALALTQLIDKGI